MMNDIFYSVAGVVLASALGFIFCALNLTWDYIKRDFNRDVHNEYKRNLKAFALMLLVFCIALHYLQRWAV